MKIEGYFKIKHDDSFCDYYRMKIVFKLPNKLFKTRITRTIITNANDDVYTYKEEEFLSRCINILSDKERLIRMAGDFVVKYIEDNKIYDNNINKRAKINEIMKNINTNAIKFEIELKEN